MTLRNAEEISLFDTSTPLMHILSAAMVRKIDYLVLALICGLQYCSFGLQAHFCYAQGYQHHYLYRQKLQKLIRRCITA